MGAGRPAKPKSERLSETVSAHVTRSELDELRQLSGDDPLGVFLRRLILRSLSARKRRGGK